MHGAPGLRCASASIGTVALALHCQLYIRYTTINAWKEMPEVWILLEEYDSGTFRITRKGWLLGGKRPRQRTGWPLPFVTKIFSTRKEG